MLDREAEESLPLWLIYAYFVCFGSGQHTDVAMSSIVFAHRSRPVLRTALSTSTSDHIVASIELIGIVFDVAP